MKNFKATITALITPFKNGAVDFASLENLVRHQIKNGVEGFVINGTTAESPTLLEKEVADIFKSVRNVVGKDFPLIMGTGSNSTAKTEELSEKAEDLGADAVLVVVPYYNKPPQRGLVKHFTEVAKSVSIPVILYNVPGRTITALSAESISELSRVQNIVGIKEASGNIEFAKEVKQKTNPEFVMLSGDDGTYVDFLKAGGHGVISVASHVIPKEMIAWKNQVASGKYEDAQAGIKKHTNLINHLFVEANPIPVKMALHYMGIIESPELRLPLVTMAEDLAQKMKTEMKTLGVL
ncbi:4-hydroxy-tetrahydrodipicolinate synthase [Bdellovibrio sp. HCB337]|uniref:4-hydroxy-tetrahydrodipicolinate synthase n=1 Tax=Bdellovibrio sp. HCB337 TaxID=3394358 RepID=UPI0039A73F9D